MRQRSTVGRRSHAIRLRLHDGHRLRGCATGQGDLGFAGVLGVLIRSGCHLDAGVAVAAGRAQLQPGRVGRRRPCAVRLDCDACLAALMRQRSSVGRRSHAIRLRLCNGHRLRGCAAGQGDLGFAGVLRVRVRGKGNKHGCILRAVAHVHVDPVRIRRRSPRAIGLNAHGAAVTRAINRGRNAVPGRLRDRHRLHGRAAGEGDIARAGLDIGWVLRQCDRQLGVALAAPAGQPDPVVRCHSLP